jgi:hypothetical protein
MDRLMPHNAPVDQGGGKRRLNSALDPVPTPQRQMLDRRALVATRATAGALPLDRARYRRPKIRDRWR